LVGSAQWRTRGGVLQHGTLPLHGDLTRIIAYLALPDAERGVQRQCLHGRATTLEEALGQALPFSQVALALTGGFAQALDLLLVPGELTGYERALAAELCQNRYAAPGWTARI
jgi:lipoate-protein ligase A